MSVTLSVRVLAVSVFVPFVVASKEIFVPLLACMLIVPFFALRVLVPLLSAMMLAVPVMLAPLALRVISLRP